jgi:hypothetical protein
MASTVMATITLVFSAFLSVSEGPVGMGPAPHVPRSDEIDSGAPLKGPNSLTEKGARKRAQARGFADIMELKKDVDGIWRGRATQQGKPVDIAIDYRGNVVATSR